MEIFTKSSEQTQEFGKKLAGDLKEGELSNVFCLYGDLGSGKTTFTQGFALGLEIKDRILSPTFVLMREYSLSEPSLNFKRFYHVDLYRFNSEKEVEVLGLEEIWNDPKNIIFIEWPEKIKGILPEKRVDIFFEYVSDEERKIKMEVRE